MMIALCIGRAAVSFLMHQNGSSVTNLNDKDTSKSDSKGDQVSEEELVVEDMCDATLQQVHKPTFPILKPEVNFFIWKQFTS